MTIPIYQADEYQKGVRSYLYEWVADVVITGDDVPRMVPEGSMVEVTTKVDLSEQMSLEIYLPDSDITITKTLPTNKKQSVDEAASRIVSDIANGYKSLYHLSEDGLADIEPLERELQEVEVENRNSSEKKAVLQHLKEVLRKIEALDGSTEWQRTQYMLDKIIQETKNLQDSYGDENSQLNLHRLVMQAEEVAGYADVRMANQLIEQLKKFKRSLEILRNYLSWVYHFDNHYEVYQWRDAAKARKAIDNALEIAHDKPSIAKLDPWLDVIFDLCIKEWKSSGGSSSSRGDSATEDIKANNCNGLLS
jgi:molecular chaperone DnaK